MAEATWLERAGEGIELEKIADLTEIGNRFTLCQGCLLYTSHEMFSLKSTGGVKPEQERIKRLFLQYGPSGNTVKEHITPA